MSQGSRTVPRRSLGRVWNQPSYRALLVSLALSGVSVSAYVPLVSLFLVRTLHVSDARVGWYTLTFAVAPVVAIIVGRLSDRLRSRLPLLVVVAVWLALGRLAMGLAPSFALAVVAGVVFGAFVAIPNAQVFAILHELLEENGEPRQATIASTIRSGYALGWAIGPVVGTALAAALGYRAALAATGVLVLVPLLPLRRLRLGAVPSVSVDRARRAASRPAGASWGSRSLWLFAVVCLLALTGEALRLSYLPVLAVDRLGVPLWLFGALVSAAPIVELGAMPAAGAAADRWGLKPMICCGLVLGAGGFTAFATSGGVGGLLLGQVLNACFTAALLGLGMTYAQRLHPGGAGFAASTFFAAQSLSPVPAGLLGGGLASRLPLAHVFFVPAVFCLVAAGLALLTRTAPAESA